MLCSAVSVAGHSGDGGVAVALDYLVSADGAPE